MLFSYCVPSSSFNFIFILPANIYVIMLLQPSFSLFTASRWCWMIISVANNPVWLGYCQNVASHNALCLGNTALVFGSAH